MLVQTVLAADVAASDRLKAVDPPPIQVDAALHGASRAYPTCVDDSASIRHDLSLPILFLNSLRRFSTAPGARARERCPARRDLAPLHAAREREHRRWESETRAAGRSPRARSDARGQP